MFEGIQLWLVIGGLMLPACLASVVTLVGMRVLITNYGYLKQLREHVVVIEQKLDIVHDLTNSRLHAIERELADTQAALKIAIGNVEANTARIEGHQDVV